MEHKVKTFAPALSLIAFFVLGGYTMHTGDLIGMFAMLVVFLIPFALLIVDNLHGTHHSCTHFGWHNGNGEAGRHTFDGASFHATCSKCGKSVMQDSQGNWF